MAKRRGFRKGSLASRTMKGYMAGRKIVKKGQKAVSAGKSFASKAKSAKNRVTGAISALRGSGKGKGFMRATRKSMKFMPFSMNKSLR